MSTESDIRLPLTGGHVVRLVRVDGRIRIAVDDTPLLVLTREEAWELAEALDALVSGG